jgi:hypothetical protein
MRRFATTALILTAALVAMPQDADAQMNAPARDGFFIGFGLGGGSFGCTDCGDRQSGVSGHFKLGGAVSERVLLGFESSGWTKEEQGARLTHANASLIAQFYPAPASGFFMKGGLGWSRLEVSATGGGVSFGGGTNGLGLTAGLGYDVRVGNSFSVSPYGMFGWGNFDGGSAQNFQLGLGLTWH